jgi:hypothetical protein
MRIFPIALLTLLALAAGVPGMPADDTPATKPKEARPAATPAEALKVMKDFKVELLYSVPKQDQGSWVNMCVDPKGRLIVSDQYGPLYRITPPPLLGNGLQTASTNALEATKVEKLDLPLGGAHGLLWAFDSLYVMVNEGPLINGIRVKRGLHRVRATRLSNPSSYVKSAVAASTAPTPSCWPPTANRSISFAATRPE